MNGELLLHAYRPCRFIRPYRLDQAIWVISRFPQMMQCRTTIIVCGGQFESEVVGIESSKCIFIGNDGFLKNTVAFKQFSIRMESRAKLMHARCPFFRHLLARPLQ